MPTIGQKLGETRREKGLTVDDVAHSTRIHPNMILSIEEDDFSKFPSVAYAKSFIRKYSDYLGVDLSAAMEHLNSGTTIRLGDNELMGEMKKTIRKDSLFRLERRPKGARRRTEKPGGAPLFLNFILFALIAALAIFYFLGYNASSIDQAKSDIASGLHLPYTPPTPVTDAPAPAAGPTPPIAPVLAPAPVAVMPAPGTPPQYPVIKPAVAVPFDDSLPDPASETETFPDNPLRPRNTPRMVFAEEPLPTLGIDDLPAVKKPAVEPQAMLRPEGTDPAATRAATPPTPPPQGPAAPQAPASNASGAGTPAPAPAAPAVRAVPVATSE
jgi:transcriptional regulator with XRE-family HTH domain